MSRGAIRTAAAAALTSNGYWSDRVYKGRHDPAAADKLPCAAVFVAREDIEPMTAANPRLLRRAVTLTVELFEKADTALEVETALDAATAAADTALLTDTTLGGAAFLATPVSVEYSVNVEAATPVGLATMEYQVLYLADEG